jgi:hypothetical protein
LPWLVLALLLLAGGWYASQRLLIEVPASRETRETFREWLWGTRSLDLVVQVGIIFVGALGIAALLPRGDEILHGGPILHGDEMLNRGPPSPDKADGAEEAHVHGRRDERL